MKPTAATEGDELQDSEQGSSLPSLSPQLFEPATAAPTSSSPDYGRPPRAPLSRQQSENLHQRNISWGLNEIKTLRVPGPIQRDRSDISNLSFTHTVTNADGSQFSINLPYQGDKNNRRVILELPNDRGFVNPLETEAETYLLRAIERAGDAADAQANIMNNVPNKAVEAMDRKFAETREQGTPQRPILSASNSRRSSFSKSTRAVKNFTAPQGTTQHKRTLTLDETLFDLSHAMDAIKAENALTMEIPVPPQRPRSISHANRPRTIGSFGRLRSNTFDSTNKTPVVEEGNEEEDELVRSNSSFVFVPVTTAAAQNEEQAVPGAAKPSGLTRRQSAKTVDAQNDTTSDIEGGGQGGNDDAEEKTGDRTECMRSSKGEAATVENQPKSLWDRTTKGIFFKEIRNFIRPKKRRIRLVCVVLGVYIAIPCLGTAAILFYLFDNPPTGVLRNYGQPIEGKLINTNGDEVDPNSTSISFFLIFAGVRQVLTFGMALLTQLFLIDFLAIDRSWLFKLGNRIPLYILQAKGWPFVLFFWSVYDWTLLAGTKPFFSHWLHFQKWVGLFNESNPDGNLISSEWNHRILALATGISLAVAIKRFWIAMFLGRQTYHRYSDKLATLMAKMVLIGEVAALSLQAVSTSGRESLRKRETTISRSLTIDEMDDLMDNVYDDASGVISKGYEESVGMTAATGVTGIDGADTIVIDPDDCNPYTGRLSNVQRNRITRLLGAWEEPNEELRNTEAVSIESLMQFRRAMTHVRTDLPFTSTFGPAGTREECVASSQEVFARLMQMSDLNDLLNFEVLALLGAKSDGTLDQNKLMDLIKLFRPDRDGSLSMVHFVRSVDKVYKEVRLLRASVHNSSKVDGQFETIFNFLFYAVVIVIVLSVLGLDPLALFISVSGLILGFAFMIGTASAKYFEGLLFILVRRPYGIGDCIHISDPNTESSYSGSPFWFVEDISLFSTQVRFSFTNERASLSNGSLANSRIINSSKSSNAGVYHLLKFPLDVPYEKVKVFHEALEAFVRNRPREWIGLSSFRAVSVNAQSGYIEYIICLDHRESWASWGQVRTSQSDLMGFGVELAKKLDIVYKQPTLPIDLNLNQREKEDLVNHMTPGNFPPLPLTVYHPQDIQGGAGDFDRPALPMDFQHLADKFPPRPPISKTD